MKKTITIKKLFKKIYYRLKAFVLLWVFYFVKLFKKKAVYFVLCERGVDARDNGYNFYCFLKKEHPEIKVFYIIDKKSPDAQRIETDLVHYGSIKNYWVVANAQKIISTHLGMCVPHIGAGFFTKICRLHKKFYWLQHGIIQNTTPNLNYKKTPMKMCVCTAIPEYNFLKETTGYSSNVLKCTGLARYDKLFPFTIKRQILIMPTWRAYILTKNKFIESSYFQIWQALLKDERLKQLLNKYQIKLIFYPHYEVQKYLDDFRSNDSNIILASFEKYDVQELLKESALLVTDYSSVAFDFAYMRKPILYFQFDSQEFFNQHYGKGYFHYENMGFGDICKTIDNLYLKIKENVINEFKVDKKYEERINLFFPFQDSKNCERIFNEIISN
ncbi:MAG: CDP-glycerol glycerophosphotransferase family protein [Clostridia bacterium]|nr:CDP-glycerol glycerophosphotransferase family protein [Clostridia bacterium]